MSEDTKVVDLHPEKAIADAMPPGTKIEIRPGVPPNVAHNIIELLKRVTVTGFEAYALVEAVTILNQFLPQPAQPGPGVPFQGLPQK